MTSKTLYPAFGLDSRVPSFLSRFYRISDDENGAAEYPDLFTHDVTFQFTSIRMSGIEGFHLVGSQFDVQGLKSLGKSCGKATFPASMLWKRFFPATVQERR